MVALFRLFGLDCDCAQPPAIAAGPGPGQPAGRTEFGLEKNLVQIGTGEGKSVTLAVAACIFALMGVEVSLACYSEYLCSRDHAAFTFLFQALGVDSLVRYGTFQTLCEREINKAGQIRDVAEALIRKSQRPASQGTDSPVPLAGGARRPSLSWALSAAGSRAAGLTPPPAPARPRVLLIDEVRRLSLLFRHSVPTAVSSSLSPFRSHR